MFHTVRFRLLFAIALVVIAGVTLMAFFGSMAATRLLQGYETHGGMMRQQRFKRLLAQHYAENKGWSNVQPLVEQLGEAAGERVILTDGYGQIVADSEGTLIGQPAGAGWGSPTVLWAGDGSTVGMLYINTPSSDTGSRYTVFLTSFTRSLLLLAVIAGGSVILLLMGASRRILAPVGALTAAVRQLEAGHLDQRVEITSQDELGELGHAFNAMAARLAQLEELRRNMVNDVAHELRTPLTNIRGYLEALQDGLVEPDRAMIDSLYEEAILLSRLVDDLQELALAEAGQLHLERRPGDLSPVVAGAVEAFRPQADAKGVVLRLEEAEPLPQVELDAQRIGQVLRNLLNNALTHTPAGGEIVVAARTTSLAARPWAELSVRDSGPGIAPEHLPYIFERFYRADKSRARATGGAGLGLAIARQLIESHGGHIEVNSQLGHGAQFTFRLPAL